MIAVIVSTAALALWAILATVELMSRDGYGRIPDRTFGPSPLLPRSL